MLTTRLAPVSPADDDAAILRRITGVVAGLEPLSAEVAAERYELGLRNEEGKIYRYLDVGGMPMVFAITEVLRGCGFTPEPGVPDAVTQVSRIVFSRPPAILPFGFARRRKVSWRSLERPTLPGGMPQARAPATPGA